MGQNKSTSAFDTNGTDWSLAQSWQRTLSSKIWIILSKNKVLFLLGDNITYSFLQIGVKGKVSNMNKGLDCDVLVAEVHRCSIF